MKTAAVVLATAVLLFPGLLLPAQAQDRKSREAQALDTGGERLLGQVYKTVGQRQLAFDLYYPPERGDAPCPVIVYTHGGGWAAGSRFGASRGSFAKLFRTLVDEGFAIVSVDYRLCKPDSGVRMRDCVIDSKDAVRYLVAHHGELGLDPGRIFVFGDSAGGHIAQMLLLTPPDSLVGAEELAEVDYRVVAGVSWYGPCDFENIALFNHDDRPDFRDRFGKRITGGEVPPEKKASLYREMSPVAYLRADSPPLLMIQGDQDTTIPVKHARRMAQAAEQVQAPVETLIVRNAGHNWRKVDADIEPSRDEILQATVDFFVEFLR